MSWQVGQRIVADATGATVRGSRIAGGAQLHIDVAFRLVEWPWKENGPISLVPQPSEVKARFARDELNLGFALPNPAQVIVPPRHSSTSSVRFTLSLSTAALVALETARDGRSIELVMTLVAHPFAVGQNPGDAPGIHIVPVGQQYPFQFQVPKEQWLAVLKSVGYCDSILTELRLPAQGPESTTVGRQRVVNAVNARNDGRYRNTVQECRIALDALKTAGFGGRAPDEVAQFLQTNARNLSQAERFSALQIAMQLFLSPAHHDGVPDEEFSREDADLAIAMTAALLRLAPRWGADSTDTSASKESAP
ncbi:MAG: hypothetical protein B6A08_04470 [Sorangiineae bacterium NIC37A_2]|nr:MAG: hypothetical protein B6A08_04470 [Sorangiineae bacterium NIC37A_2]